MDPGDSEGSVHRDSEGYSGVDVGVDVETVETSSTKESHDSSLRLSTWRYLATSTRSTEECLVSRKTVTPVLRPDGSRNRVGNLFQTKM